MTLCPIYSSTRNDILQCFVCSPIPKVSEKKGATTQSFIRKEITSYKLHTLGTITQQNYWSFDHSELIYFAFFTMRHPVLLLLISLILLQFDFTYFGLILLQFNFTLVWFFLSRYLPTMCRNGNFGLVFGRGESLLTYMIFVYHWTS